ncbi:hypothetical protein IM793_22070 [Pedobacter sp. MR2016-19]|uniref:hypothetical protein n=1 Tax=Pedobacter sp. MR2016-19 TaxID=2780089 RepID=UPI0018743866|nr:hypothetical protein [Pedobacter sp. MR2016-19]MBE5321858.1 hypothetical protein [Pedobacter sp. MR2016-19]
MEKEIKCSKCDVETIIIENRLFFTEERKVANIICPSCNTKIAEEPIDGWFFIQTKEQYNFQLQIDRQKEEIKFEGII